MYTNAAEFIVDLLVSAIFGLILSWSVGLTPALVYRYGIYKRPIEKKKVFWRLAPIIVVLMFAYKLTMAGLSGEPPKGNPLPWIIIYYIGKWIMTREPNQKTILCPHCNKTLLWQQERAGQVASCPSCRKFFRFPAQL